MNKSVGSLMNDFHLSSMKGSLMLKICLALFLSISCFQNGRASNSSPDSVTFFKANHPYIQYTGRIDFSNPLLPRFWAPGCYIKATFTGPDCQIVLNDEELWGKNHNYLEVVVDENKQKQNQTTTKKKQLHI